MANLYTYRGPDNTWHGEATSEAGDRGTDDTFFYEDSNTIIGDAFYNYEGERYPARFTVNVDDNQRITSLVTQYKSSSITVTGEFYTIPELEENTFESYSKRIAWQHKNQDVIDGTYDGGNLRAWTLVGMM